MCLSCAHMGRTLADTEFAAWLDGQLKDRGWGVRTLARRMAPGMPRVGDPVEVARRALNRYLFDGSYPGDENKALIASSLGVVEADLPDRPFRAAAAA